MLVGHVIYFSSSGCALWSWRGSRFEPGAVHTAVGADPAPVVAELRRLPAAPVAVLVDMIDEEHVRDAVPRLGRGDRRALVERKLARAFPRTAYRTALVQGRSATNPDEDEVLLSALTRPEPLRILMQRLAEARLPVAGVFSPALLAAQLLDAEARTAPAVMLVLRRSNGRLQHSFFRAGRLAGSRRLRAPGTGDTENAGLMVRQVEESLRYFDASFAASASEPLQVLLTPADHAMLAPAGEHGEGWQLRVQDLTAARRRHRLVPALDADTSERVLIGLLRRPSGVPSYAPADDRRYLRLFRARGLARAACFVLAAVAAAGTAYNALVITDANRRMADENAAVQAMASMLPDEETSPGRAPDPLEMQQAVLAYDALVAHQADPAEVLATVAAAVTRQPRIQLDAIEWHVVEPAAPADAEGEAAQETGAEAAAGDEAPAAVAATPASGVTVRIRGHLRPFDGDYPLAFGRLQAFVDVLREQPGVTRVVPIEQPLDIRPTSTLSGELAGNGAAPEANFTLELLWRPGDDAA